MDIMMRLEGAGFSAIANEFHQREKRLGGGLPLHDFVEIVLRGLPRPRSPEEKYASINALVDLFEDIDINGDGTMEFDEFTSFCVDAGMVATRLQATKLKHRYVRQPKHMIKTMNGCVGIEKIKWSAQFQRFLVIENTAKSVKLYSVDGKLVTEVRPQSTLQAPVPDSPRTNGDAERKDATGRSPRRRSEHTQDASTTPATASTVTGQSGIFILDAAFVHKYQCLAVSTTDFVISFYSMDEPKHQLAAKAFSSVIIGPTYDILPKLTMITTTAQLTLRFCETAGLLFSTGNDRVVNVWKIMDRDTKILWKRLLEHRDMVLDILEIPEHDLLATCDLHGSILLWDINDCRPRGSLVGHTHGVKQLVYSKDHDLLLSAGFEFDAFGWDVASRQVVMKLAGHRAPLIGIQLTQFHTERAVTADSSGVIKLWDISRGGNGAISIAASSSQKQSGGRGASQAVLLESIDPSHSLSRFEPTTFVSLHPQRRDLWVAAAGSATLHLFRSVRVQQFDEIPLKAFYNYNANRFIVVCGPVCSIWDGEKGSCVDECQQIGASIGFSGGNSRESSNGDAGGRSKRSAVASSSMETPSTTHNGMGATTTESSSDILLAVQDTKCKKLVLLSEEGDMGVFNSQNLIQMRRCREKFHGVRDPSISSMAQDGLAPSCGIVGLHYCSENKLIIATDAHTSAIIVIDDSNHDLAKGIQEMSVLRRLTHIPGGISASAYGYHASMIATIDEATSETISVWDFETLMLLSSCHLDETERATGEDSTLHVMEFWDEYPVLLTADLQGAIYFFAVMPTKTANTGKLLHAFVNDHSVPPPATTAVDSNSSTIKEETGEDVAKEEVTGNSSTFLTEAAETMMRKLLRRRKTRKSSKTDGGENPEIKAQESHGKPLGGVVACMKVALDEENPEQPRWLLFVGDDQGMIRIWDLNAMMRRLSLFKIPESKSKYLRRGYHPRATFSRDYSKETALKGTLSTASGKAGTEDSDWRHSLLYSDTRNKRDFVPSQSAMKKLSKQRIEAKKTSIAPNALTKFLPPNKVTSATAPPAAGAVAAAEAFLVAPQQRKSTSRSSSTFLHPSNNGGGLVLTRDRMHQLERRRSQCWQNQDVTIVHAWAAHRDGITSMEVSKNPNIIVTCGLDMRVFVWNWQGMCLGRLFDAENVGLARWRFQKDDSKRQAERHTLVTELMQTLDLNPHERAQRRRATVYQNHVQRRTLNEIPHVSLMLLDHIVSRDPEIAALERSGLLKQQDETSNGGTEPTGEDQQINAELEKQRKRNYQTKLMMLQSLHRTPQSAASKTDLQAREKRSRRMKSLAQVGPLLVTDRFERKTELTAAPMIPFQEEKEAQRQRQYLEDELTLQHSKNGRLKAGNMQAIKQQIRDSQAHAEEMFQNKVALQRHAAAMYGNLHELKSRSKFTLNNDEDEASQSIEKMLEPSPFLQSRLPASALSTRPQTAPNHQTSRSPATLTRAKSSGKLTKARACAIAQQRPLTASVSASSFSTRREGVSSPASDSRRGSLDMVYLSPLSQQKNEEQDDESVPTNELTTPSASPSVRKLESINNIINKAQEYCEQSAVKEASSAPGSTEKTVDKKPRMASVLEHHDESDEFESREEVDEDTLRAHLERTKHRMQLALNDGLGSFVSHATQKKQHVEQSKKDNRMEEYLQQKRREMNTNIGSVFKRTSFAFQSRPGDENALESTSKKKPPLAAGQPKALTMAMNAQARVEKNKVFGIYGVKEVMSVIRLFWSMDEDVSGHLSLPELLAYSSFFEKLGYHDMTTVFQAIDKDGNGNISLRELLEICFHYANKSQIDEMLTLAKMGNVGTYLHASQRASTVGGGASADLPVELLPEARAELVEIFRVFDKNGDGGVSMDEIMEALRVDDDEATARVMTKEQADPRSSRPSSASAVSSGLTKDDVRKLYQEFDRDGNQTLDFNEFVGLMQSLYGPRVR
ncbi:hypothetical protein Poli38472_013198 [Pythium oligandrum]|uniref:EF-hand domain-containing protein n=1 Tax=Pythium oligandrum TaxID=41045 RepID=A0A8K1FD85_PYTOL|nr:hypothetical protein Poli38472_013198 [Pythium oligandrum]|eukprot:TMW55307.1 hypothetical protein Poli38472_013198 [Pythium oligandrum]